MFTTKNQYTLKIVFKKKNYLQVKFFFITKSFRYCTSSSSFKIIKLSSKIVFFLQIYNVSRLCSINNIFLVASLQDHIYQNLDKDKRKDINT